MGTVDSYEILQTPREEMTENRAATINSGQRICFTSCLGRWCCFYAYFYNQFILITLARSFSALYTFILTSFFEAAGSIWSKVIGLQICLTSLPQPISSHYCCESTLEHLYMMPSSYSVKRLKIHAYEKSY